MTDRLRNQKTFMDERRNATNYILNQLGICTRCFGSMPCLECGRGL